jgi:hypothetical protein
LTRDFPPRREIAEGVLTLAVVSVVCALLVFLPNEPWKMQVQSLAELVSLAERVGILGAMSGNAQSD